MIWARIKLAALALAAGLVAYWKHRSDKLSRVAGELEARKRMQIELIKLRDEQRKRRDEVRRSKKRDFFTKSLVFVAAATLVACATSQPRTTLPDRPVLPTVEPEALQCLSDTTYETLVERELRLREYAEELEVLCGR